MTGSMTGPMTLLAVLGLVALLVVVGPVKQVAVASRR